MSILPLNFYLLFVFTVFSVFQPISAFGQIIDPGRYQTLGKQFEYNFKSTADFTGKYKNNFNKIVFVEGVYRTGDDICWLPKEDGTKGRLGNTLIFFDQSQCCLQIENIGEKLVVSFVWQKPYGSSGICQNQVLKKFSDLQNNQPEKLGDILSNAIEEADSAEEADEILPSDDYATMLEKAEKHCKNVLPTMSMGDSEFNKCVNAYIDIRQY